MPLTASASFGGGISATILKVIATTATGSGPGEVSGPALQLSIQVKNGSSKPLDLSNVSVALEDSTKVPGLLIVGTSNTSFSGVLDAGRSATGVYLFTVPPSNRSPISVSVSYSTEAPQVLFVGNAK